MGIEAEGTKENVLTSDADLPIGDHIEDADAGQHREDDEENQDIIKVFDGERDMDREIPLEYTIYGARAGGQNQEMGSIGADSSS